VQIDLAFILVYISLAYENGYLQVARQSYGMATQAKLVPLALMEIFAGHKLLRKVSVAK
jgi:hypothetical protein